jgi:hypothetical protein
MLAAQDTFGGFGPLLFLIGAILIVTGFTASRRLYRILRDRHPSVYESLGQPTLFWNNSPRHGWAMMRFILAGHFNATGDEELISLCRFIRVMTYLTWTFFIVVVILGFSLSTPQ